MARGGSGRCNRAETGDGRRIQQHMIQVPIVEQRPRALARQPGLVGHSLAAAALRPP